MLVVTVGFVGVDEVVVPVVVLAVPPARTTVVVGFFGSTKTEFLEPKISSEGKISSTGRKAGPVGEVLISPSVIVAWVVPIIVVVAVVAGTKYCVLCRFPDDSLGTKKVWKF